MASNIDERQFKDSVFTCSRCKSKALCQHFEEEISNPFRIILNEENGMVSFLPLNPKQPILKDKRKYYYACMDCGLKLTDEEGNVIEDEEKFDEWHKKMCEEWKRKNKNG